MKEDIRASGLHEPEEDFRRGISRPTPTTGNLVSNIITPDQLLYNDTLNNRTANENDTNQHNENKINVSTILVNGYNNIEMSKSNNTRELLMERIPSIAYKHKLEINNITIENSSNPLRSIAKESAIIKQTLDEIMNFNVSLDNSDDDLYFRLGSTVTAKYKADIGRSYLNSTSNDTVISAMRRDFEPKSLKSFYTGDRKSEMVKENHRVVPTEMEVKENRHKRASTLEVREHVSMDKEIRHLQRRDFVLDSLKSIYIKNIRKDFNLTTERNVNMTLYKLPFNFRAEEESALANETTTDKNFETTNMSKGSQKLNAILFKIPEIISKINKTLGNYSAANFHTPTFNHGKRAFDIDSLHSEYTKNISQNINSSVMNDNSDVLKNTTTPAMEHSNFRPDNNTETEKKNSTNQETTTVTIQDLHRRKQPQQDSENIKSVIDLGVFKKLMDAARKNKKVRKITFKTPTVDTTVNSREDSGETKFVNVWRETYLKPKAKLSHKTGALVNLINKLNWKLAKSDKTAMENVYGPAANQSLVPQFRRLWDFFWKWYYDPESKLCFFKIFFIVHIDQYTIQCGNDSEFRP